MTANDPVRGKAISERLNAEGVGRLAEGNGHVHADIPLTEPPDLHDHHAGEYTEPADRPEDKVPISNPGFRNGQAIELDDETVGGNTSVQDIEAGFWERRESLQTIYDAALARMCSPWAVLGVCAARALAMVPPGVTLPPLIGSCGSLNWFCALASASGLGKSAALAATDDLIGRGALQLNIGSGEGMVEAYRKPRDKETGEPEGVHESIMFTADEIGTLAALTGRNGSTLMGMLRSAFTGATLGFSTKSSNGFHLLARSYRMTLVVGVQPARAGAILDDHGAGTPQRFMWFPATDERITAEPPVFPGVGLGTPYASDKWRYGAELQIPAEARNAILAARAKAVRGEGDPLDSHALFMREKFAYALAVLDGRDDMTSQDWELSGIAMKVSDHTRAWVQKLRERADHEEAVQLGRVQGVRRAAADDEQAHQVSQRRNRIARGIVEKLTAAGTDGLTTSALSQSFASRDRGLVESVLPRLVDDGHVAKGERQPKDKTDRWVIVADE